MQRRKMNQRRVKRQMVITTVIFAVGALTMFGSLQSETEPLNQCSS